MHERDGIYLRVNTDPYRQVYVFGDLHGCYDALQASLQANAFDPEQDLLISVGDLTDRGAQNIECLELLTQPWFLAVQGNHELMAINFLLHDKEEVNWYRNGGQWFWALREIEQERALELFTLANALPLVIELNIAGKKIVIAHADYPDNHYEFGKAVDGFQFSLHIIVPSSWFRRWNRSPRRFFPVPLLRLRFPAAASSPAGGRAPPGPLPPRPGG